MRILVLCMLLLAAALPLQAKVLWQDWRLTYLHGEHYRLGDAKRQVYTFEHAAGTSWGDSFFFLDHMRSANGGRSNYAEWAPRVSLAKITGNTWQYALVKDVLLAGQIEMSSVATNHLFGIGLDLAIPGLQFFQLNGYRRDNDHVADNWQLTLVWARSFKLGQQQFLYDGFLDWASTSADQAANINITSQLKWLASDMLGITSKLYLGVEYVYWRNKFGVADSPALRSNESNINLLIKWHF